MNYHTEVLVIGCGPAGLSTAYSAAKHGLRVLVIDRKREIGVPIQCGEFLPAPSEYKNILPDAKHLSLLVGIPKNIIQLKTSSVSLYSPSGEEYNAKFKGYVIDRERFDKWLALLVCEQGGQIELGTTAIKLSIDENKVYVKGRNYKGWVYYEYLVCATGAKSPIDNQIPIKPNNQDYDISIVYQEVLGGLHIDTDKIYMFSGLDYAPGAYAWIIPRGRLIANVGLGVRKPYNPKGNLKTYINSLLKKHPYVKKIYKNVVLLSYIAGLVPVGPPPKTAVYKNILLVGDAANMVISCLGAGVPTAVIAGQICGEVLGLYPNDLHKYDEFWKEEILNVLEAGYKIRVLMDPILKSDLLMNLSLKLIGEKMLNSLIRLKIPKGFTAIYNIIKSRKM